jgi:SSS family solute:Na+ symporter
MASAVGIDKLPEFAPQFAQYKSNFAVPALILHAFPASFAGVAFAAIGIGGLVPAAIMSIAASNLFTRNIYVPFIRPDCTPKQEAQNAKTVSLVVKFGALVFIIFLPLQYAIELQLLGGIWRIKTSEAPVLRVSPDMVQRRRVTGTVAATVRAPPIETAAATARPTA